MHAVHTRLYASLQAVLSYSVPDEQVVQVEHPEVTVSSELQIFALEPARARVHCWLVCDGWCRGTVRGRGLLGRRLRKGTRATSDALAALYWSEGQLPQPELQSSSQSEAGWSSLQL